MKSIGIINGPNLNLLGRRQPEIYGSTSFEDYFIELRKVFPTTILHYYQSNHEGDLIDKLHEWGFELDGIILNAGGYTHTSIALRDAVSSIETPVVEVHISDISNREEFRKYSFIEDVALESIIGKGLNGYDLGIKRILAIDPS